MHRWAPVILLYLWRRALNGYTMFRLARVGEHGKWEHQILEYEDRHLTYPHKRRRDRSTNVVLDFSSQLMLFYVRQ